MTRDWFERVRSSIPRGFSRLYVMHLLKEKPMTGKEIIDEAEKQSAGRWKPSPGLVYPLLGRLLTAGLVEETDGGKYVLTEKGVKELERIDQVRGKLSEQFDLLPRLGTVGMYFVTEIFDRMAALVSMIGENIDRLSDEQREMYRRLLRRELQRLEAEEGKPPSE